MARRTPPARFSVPRRLVALPVLAVALAIAITSTMPSPAYAVLVPANGGAAKPLTQAQRLQVAHNEYLGMTQIPMFNSDNPAAGTLNEFQLVIRAAAFGFMLSILTVGVLSQLANGTLLSGAGPGDAAQVVLGAIVYGGAMVAWNPLFRDVVAAVNALCTVIVNAPFARTAMHALFVKLAASSVLTAADAAVLAAGEVVGGLRLATGLSIASFIATGNPIIWVLDFVVVLLFLVGQLVIQLERVILYTTVAILYVAGPLALGLGAVRGLNSITSAFFRVAQGVLAIVVLWSIELVLVAILNGGIFQFVWTQNPDAWWGGIINSLSVLVLMVMMIFTPGYVRRVLGAGGGHATGMIRTAAIVGFAASRLHRGVGGGGGTRQPRPVRFRTRAPRFPAPAGAGGSNLPSPTAGGMRGPAPTAARGGNGPAPTGVPGVRGPAPVAGAGANGPAPTNGAGAAGSAPSGVPPVKLPGATTSNGARGPASTAPGGGSAPPGTRGVQGPAPTAAPSPQSKGPGGSGGLTGPAPTTSGSVNGSGQPGSDGRSFPAPSAAPPAMNFQPPITPGSVDGPVPPTPYGTSSAAPAASGPGVDHPTPTAGPPPREAPLPPLEQPRGSSPEAPPSSSGPSERSEAGDGS